MKFNPHEYQKYAIQHIKRHKTSALLLDMGLGKTVTTLTAVHDLMFDDFEVKKVLIIAPLRVAFHTWPEEVKKWEHLNDLTVSKICGTPKQRRIALKQPTHLYLINRENVDWLVNKSGVPFDFDMIVIDELSSFKSFQSKRFKALMKVRPFVKRIVGLTGTPSSNGLMDLFAQFRLLDMGERLGRYISHYREKYFLPDKRNHHMIFTYKLKEGAEQAIYDKISDITISMKSSEYLKMPELVVNDVQIELSEKERKHYDTLKQEMILSLEGKEIDAVNAASLSNKLLQMANGAVYDESKEIAKIHNQKLDALEELIESANGKPFLIAYWFQHDLKRMQERFKVRPIKTNADIEEWNQGKIEIATIHPASAGHGLNLQTGGSTLIWFGLTWSLELYQQTNARLYRQGQKDTVVIHHIVAKDTIDEDVLCALKAKEKTQDSLIESVKARLEEVR